MELNVSTDKTESTTAARLIARSNALGADFQ